MKRFEKHKAYLVCMVIMSVFISILAGCGGGGGGSWTEPVAPGTPGVPVVPGALAVTAVSPSAGSIVPINTKVISAAFNKEMAPATLTPASFTLACNGSPITGGAVTYLAAGSLATLTLPAANLPGLAACTATITTVARDLTGNSLAANYSWNFTTSSTADSTNPRVSSTVPLTSTPGPTGVLTSTPITATFDKVMDPTTITAAGAFTVAGVTAAAIPVTYNIATRTATFHPLAALNPGVTYTATIKGTGVSPVKDSLGNALAGVSTQPAVPNDYVWTFTTAVVVPPPALNISMFGIAATAGVRNTGSTTINGNAVLDPSPLCNSVQIDAAGGFGLCGGSPPIINGQVISPLYPDAGITSGVIKSQLLAEFLSITPPSGPPAAGSLGGGINLPAGTTLGAPTGSALVQGDNLFVPGVYQSLTSIMITGDITLDAQGNPNGKFVFQSSSTVGTADGAASPGTHTRILLINGAKASNVSWQAGSAATLGTNSDFHGNILASADITMKTGATSCGRLLAGAFTAGAFVFDSNVVSVPGNVNAPPSCQ